jgi:hypothetical protein
MSALSLQRLLEIGSYQTAWAMLHRLRSVLVRPGRDRLAGTVEVDETDIGGEEAGLSGGRARGKKALTGIAVEVREPKRLGRCRMAPLADASADSLHAFVTDHVEPGAVVITDGWAGYAGLARLGYVHDRRSQRAARALGEDPNQLLPAVHRVASLAKRWLLGTHQGSGRRRPPAQLPERVRVPFQPTPLAQPRDGVLPGARARRRPSASALPRPHRQSTTEHCAPPTAGQPRSPAEHGAAARRTPLEVRLDGTGYPRRPTLCRPRRSR